MYSIIFLSVYVIFYSKIWENPNGGRARFLRKILPIILLVIGCYFIFEKLEYGYVPTLERLNAMTAVSLIQGYAALWLIHVLTSITWLISKKNSSSWITLPWKKGGSKINGIIWNGFLCIGLVPFLAIHMIIVAFIFWAFFKIKSKRDKNNTKGILAKPVITSKNDAIN